jgi:hypothetical protein
MKAGCNVLFSHKTWLSDVTTSTGESYEWRQNGVNLQIGLRGQGIMFHYHYARNCTF